MLDGRGEKKRDGKRINGRGQGPVEAVQKENHHILEESSIYYYYYYCYYYYYYYYY